MQKNYVTFNELIKEAGGMSATTARRYIDTFKNFIPSKKFGKVTKYELEAVEVLTDISKGYESKLSVVEIKEQLSYKYQQTIDMDTEAQIPLQQPENVNALQILQSNNQAILEALIRIDTMLGIIQTQNQRATEQDKKIEMLEHEIQELKKTTTEPPQQKRGLFGLFRSKPKTEKENQ